MHSSVKFLDQKHASKFGTPYLCLGLPCKLEILIPCFYYTRFDLSLILSFPFLLLPKIRPSLLIFPDVFLLLSPDPKWKLMFRVWYSWWYNYWYTQRWNCSCCLRTLEMVYEKVKSWWFFSANCGAIFVLLFLKIN